MTRFAVLADAAIAGRELDASDAAELVELSEGQPFDLFHEANRIRERVKGRAVRLCSIINARSGACSEDCSFCAQSARYRTGVAVYPLVEPGRIARAAEAGASAGASAFGIVTSGRGPDRDLARICEAVAEIARRHGGSLECCASLGSLTEQSAAALKAAGLVRYHHNLETARSFFPRVCSTHSYDDRVRTLCAAKAAGLQVCSGGIFGLGEQWPHRIEMAIELRALGVGRVPINFLNPIPGTPLEGAEPLAPLEGLRIIAIYRFLLPKADIMVAGGRQRCLGDLQSWVFYAGANAMMIGNYLTTAGRPPEDDLRMIRALGLQPA